MSDLDCTICHESNLEEVGELDICDHCFCVRCILEWSKISNTCPLCKQRFWVIHHKRLDMSKLGNSSVNVADKFPGEVLVTHQVSERNQAPAHENGEEFEDPLDSILCMECGGAQDEDLTLLCEGCNQGCHSYCANPPIEDITAIGDWYCSACAPTLAPTILRGRRSQSTRPSATEEERLLLDRTTESRAARRRTRNRLREQALANSSQADSLAGLSGSSEDESEEDESGMEREQFISGAAAAIAGNHPYLRPFPKPLCLQQGDETTVSGVGRTTAFRGLRGTARTGRLRRLQGLLPGSEDDSTRAASRREKSGEDAMRPRREARQQHPSRASMHNTALRNRARLQNSRSEREDGLTAAPSLAHRNVEGLRLNWDALRREEIEFGQKKQPTVAESSDEDPGDSLSLADRASIIRAKRILEEQNLQRRRSDRRNGALNRQTYRAAGPAAAPALLTPSLSFSAQCRAELAHASAISRQIGPSRGARPAMSKSLSKKSGPLGMKRRAEQADGLAGSGLPKRQRESRGTDNGAVQSEDTDEGMLRGKWQQQDSWSDAERLATEGTRDRKTKPEFGSKPVKRGEGDSRPSLSTISQMQRPPSVQPRDHHRFEEAQRILTTPISTPTVPSAGHTGRDLPGTSQAVQHEAAASLKQPHSQNSAKLEHDSKKSKGDSTKLEYDAKKRKGEPAKPEKASARLEVSGGNGAASEDSGMSCPALFETRDHNLSSIPHEPLVNSAELESKRRRRESMHQEDEAATSSEGCALERVIGISDNQAANDHPEEDIRENATVIEDPRYEAERMAILQHRKDTAARDVKQHIERWFKEKKISLVEFKAVAKLATHELYKGSAEVGSRLWHESEKYIVRKVLKDLRAVRHAS